MSDLLALSGILAAMFIGAVSPGPSFVLVSRIAITSSRKAGLAAALGMGLGGFIFATLAVAGLTAMLLKVQWLYVLLKLAGGAYLLYLAWAIWRGANDSLHVSNDKSPAYSPARSFKTALVVQLSNPKTAIVYASIFAAMLPSDPARWLLVAIPVLVSLVEASWYAVVAFVFSADKPQSIYLKSKSWIDRTAGAVIGILGTRLVFEAFNGR